MLMTDANMTARSATSGLSGLLERLRNLLRNDRGDALIEVIGVMVVVSIVSALFTQSSIGLNQGQNRAHNVDVSIQVARGIIEQAKATPWNSLGFATTDPGYTPYDGGQFENRNVVELPSTSLPATSLRIMPKTTETVRGVSITARTHITYGYIDTNRQIKVVTVNTSYVNRGRTSSHTYSVMLAAEPSDKNPPAVPFVGL
jgi:type II secretory pathway pseudopilin PulG